MTDSVKTLGLAREIRKERRGRGENLGYLKTGERERGEEGPRGEKARKTGRIGEGRMEERR